MAKRAHPEEPSYRPLLNTDLISAAVAVQPVKPVANVLPSAAPNLELLESSNRTTTAIPTREPPVVPHVSQNFAEQVHESPGLEPLDKEKRVLFTASEARALDKIAYQFSMSLKTQIKTSHVVRAMIRIFMSREEGLLAEASSAAPLARPSNASLQEIRAFEQSIADLMEAALLKRPRNKTIG